MQFTFRTVLRGFLIVAGAYFLVTGALSGTVLELLLGAAGVLLGGGGLYTEWRSSAVEADDLVSIDAADDDSETSDSDNTDSVADASVTDTTASAEAQRDDS